jgi:hypothetical protein
MMLYFDYPAKLFATVLDKNNKNAIIYTPTGDLEKIIGNRRILCFQNFNAYYCTKTQKLKLAKAETTTFFLEVFKNNFVYLTQKENIYLLENTILTLGEDYIFEIITTMKNKMKNIDETNRQKAEVIEASKKARMEEALQRSIRDKEKLQKKAELLEKNVLEYTIKFKNNEKIPLEYFEIICKRNNINIHIKTLGAIRKYVSYVGIGQYQTSKPVNGLWTYINQLHSTLHEDKNVLDDPEVEKLFAINYRKFK